MTDNSLKRVQKFHEAFDLGNPNTPNIPSPEIIALRIALIQEELDEVREALERGDLADVAQEITDLSIVVDGTFISCGLADYKDALSKAVFESNMSKLDENGQPIYREDGKVLKGPNYFKPDIASVLGLDNNKDAA